MPQHLILEPNPEALPLRPLHLAVRSRSEDEAEFVLGLGKWPCLADHQVHDLIVLPGSFCIEMARLLYAEKFPKEPSQVCHVQFQAPLLLAGGDALIRVRTRENGSGGGLLFAFYEQDPQTRSAGAPAVAFAQLEMRPVSRAPRPTVPFSAEELAKESGTRMDGEHFYRRLAENGNRYGRSFQSWQSVWLREDQAIGQWLVPALAPSGRGVEFNPVVMDALVQLLAGLGLERGKAFVWRASDRIELEELDLPSRIWARARLIGGGSGPSSLRGDVEVFTEAGRPLLALRGVILSFLDRLVPAGAPTAPHARETDATPICITSTFTAEPVRDSIDFWSELLELNMGLEFAPYNQVFQQLLDRESLLSRNEHGVNVVLIGLEDWLSHEQQERLQSGPARAAAAFGGRSAGVLGNGLEVAELNRYETQYLYGEIFEDQCYLRHGIRLREGATVVDIGANIGLFSLFAASQGERVRVYAYEPSPVVFPLLQANSELHGQGRIRAFPWGVSDRNKTAQFTFYENSSVFSSFYPDPHQDEDAVRAVVGNVLKHELSGVPGGADEYVDQLMAGRLDARRCECRLTSVSEIIREHGLTRIDLLKIDAEKSELDVLAGIGEADWPLIDQIVLEVHDRTGRIPLQVKEQLTARGFHCAITEEKLLTNSGLFNLYATRAEVAATPPSLQPDSGLTRRLDEFWGALSTFRQHCRSPLLLLVAPRTARAGKDVRLCAVLEAAERELATRAEALPDVRCVRSQSIFPPSLAGKYSDLDSHEMGHVPYTLEGYAALGTSLSRNCFAQLSRPCKVIVLDCDNTLWKGVCAEDGPDGIEVTKGHQYLHQLLLRQWNAGLLLCLCSKNQEPDVWAVFDRRQEMLLRREHLTAWRVNWRSKSENLAALAQELQLGLDSFLFLDDNPVECAEVRAHCPEVLVLQLPSESHLFPTFLENIWAFDAKPATEEDRHRTRWYRENLERQRFRAQESSLKEFVDGLQLQIDLAAPAEGQLGRVAQLTVRTSQFNMTGLARSEAEIRAFLQHPGARALVASVKDRFGDYGLVGAMLCVSEQERLTVDTFLLSCRALGKGVEHRMLAELARQAASEGKRFVALNYTPTARNRPAFEFLQWVGARLGRNNNAGGLSLLPASELTDLAFDPDPASAAVPDRERGPTERATGQTSLARAVRDRPRWAQLLERIGSELNTPERVYSAMQDRQAQARPHLLGPIAEPAGSRLEQDLGRIWRSVLGKQSIGLKDNFFEAGGTSLKAVLVAALIKKELQKNLSIVTLFECPTIQSLAQRLTASPEPELLPQTAEEAGARGRQRRQKMLRRRMT